MDIDTYMLHERQESLSKITARLSAARGGGLALGALAGGGIYQLGLAEEGRGGLQNRFFTPDMAVCITSKMLYPVGLPYFATPSFRLWQK